MKKTLLALMGAVLFALPAFALVGGPWDNNIPGNPTLVNPANVNGTYQGTIKGKNLAGVIRFTSSTNGQVVITSTTWTIVISGSTSIYVPEVTTQIFSTTGYASIFFEGKSGQAVLDTVIDLGGRKISGLINGMANRPVPVILSRPSDGQTWTLTDSAYFNGAFSANFATWATNSFKGKGTLNITKFDYIGFWQDLILNPATANPQNHIVDTTMPIKIAGVKTTDAVALFLPPTISAVYPTVVENP